MAKKKSPLKKAKSKVSPAKKSVAKKLAKKTAGMKPAAIKKSAVKKSVVEKKLIGQFLKELEQEVKTTRKMLQRVPLDNPDWRPHAKSMPIQRLATHIAELPSWASMAINTDELNFAAGNYVPKVVKNNEELLEVIEEINCS